MTLKLIPLIFLIGLMAGCASTPKVDLNDGDGLSDLLLGRQQIPGLAQKYDEQGEDVYADKVNMFYHDKFDGKWKSKIISVVSISEYRAAACFKSKPGNRVDCYYIKDSGEVMFMDVIIQGYEET